MHTVVLGILCQANRPSGAAIRCLKPLGAAVAVDLWDESISDMGVANLAASLPQSQLRVLGLWGTPFTDGKPGEDAAREACSELAKRTSEVSIAIRI